MWDCQLPTYSSLYAPLCFSLLSKYFFFPYILCFYWLRAHNGFWNKPIKCRLYEIGREHKHIEFKFFENITDYSALSCIAQFQGGQKAVQYMRVVQYMRAAVQYRRGQEFRLKYTVKCEFLLDPLLGPSIWKPEIGFISRLPEKITSELPMWCFAWPNLKRFENTEFKIKLFSRFLKPF